MTTDYSAEHLRAFTAWRDGGHSLKGLDSEQLEALLEDEFFRGDIAAERARRTKAAAPAPKPETAPPAAHQPRIALPTDAELKEWETPEGFEAWATRHAGSLVPVALWAGVVTSARRLRKELEARVVALEARIAELDAKIPEFKGLWEVGRIYPKASMVMHDGSAWYAMAATDEKPGDGATSWRLFVKQGKAGRDGRNGKDRDDR